MNILFLNPTRRVEFINYFLHLDGIEVFIACSDRFDPTMQIFKKSFLIDSELNIEQIIDLCLEQNIDLLIPWLENDMIKLYEHMQDFSLNNIVLAMGESKGTKTAFSKKLTIDFLCDVGLTKFVLKYLDILDIHEGNFPIVIKPIIGSGSVGVKVLQNMNHLDEYLPNLDQFIIQEFLPGTEYTVDAFCVKGIAKCCIPRKRLKFRGGEVLTSKVVENKQIIELTKTICSSLELDGPVNIQFIEDITTTPLCTDVNPRISGGIPLSIEAGANFPKALVDYYLHKAEPIFNDDINWNLAGARWLNTIFFETSEKYNKKNIDYSLMY